LYTDEQFDQLEQEEHSLTEEAFMALALALTSTHKNLENEIREFYQKYGKDGVVTYQEARKWVSQKNHSKRLFILYSFIGKTFDDSFLVFEGAFRNHLKSIIQSEIDFFNLDSKLFDIDKILNMGWGVDDLNWYDRLLNYHDKWIKVLSDDLKLSFIKRDNIMDVLNDLDKRFVSMEKILWRLYVTESTAVGSLARREIFKELGVKNYRFYAREDERTCEHCGSLHGLTFPLSAFEVGVTASPIHSHCRCWEVPIWE